MSEHKESGSSSNTSDVEARSIPVDYTRESAFRKFVDGFKRMDVSDYEKSGLSDVEVAARATAAAPLKRSLKNRHLQMIAIGGSIGTGLFVGSGDSFRSGGPAAVLIGFTLIGTMLFNTVHALGELAVRYPVSGSFATYSTRFLDPAWGFAMGWNYALQWLILFPLELVAASLTIGFWRDNGSAASKVNPDVWVAVFYVVVLFINIFGVKGYGEAEFIFGTIKTLSIIGFIIFGIIINCGGGPNGEYIGGKYWHDPGAFSHGVKGVIAVFVNAAFAFAGTEMVGLAAAETDNPKKHVPRATKQVFWRVCSFYVVGLLIVGLLVPYNDPRLLGSGDATTNSNSPFVIAIRRAGVSGLPSVMNVVILISVLSVGNSSVYGGSRTLVALGAQGQAPKCFGYVDRRGRPLVAMLVSFTFGLLGFLAGSDKQEEVFNWLLSFSGLSNIVTWGSICLCHIRFRRALKVQGISDDVLAFKAGFGVGGSWYGFAVNVIVVCLQFWIALTPVGESVPDAQNFFQGYLSAIVIVLMYIPWKIYFKTKVVRAKDMDLHTGVRDLDVDRLILENREEQERVRAKGLWYRIYKFWC